MLSSDGDQAIPRSTRWQGNLYNDERKYENYRKTSIFVRKFRRPYKQINQSHRETPDAVRPERSSGFSKDAAQECLVHGWTVDCLLCLVKHSICIAPVKGKHGVPSCEVVLESSKTKLFSECAIFAQFLLDPLQELFDWDDSSGTLRFT